MLVFWAADFEDFRQPRPDMPPEMEPELDAVVRILVQNRWPWRLHASCDETISRGPRRVRAREPGHAARRPTYRRTMRSPVQGIA
jgi:predicted amidohydrolase YtcJ